MSLAGCGMALDHSILINLFIKTGLNRSLPCLVWFLFLTVQQVLAGDWKGEFVRQHEVCKWRITRHEDRFWFNLWSCKIVIC